MLRKAGILVCGIGLLIDAVMCVTRRCRLGAWDGVRRGVTSAEAALFASLGAPGVAAGFLNAALSAYLSLSTANRQFYLRKLCINLQGETVLRPAVLWYEKPAVWPLGRRS